MQFDKHKAKQYAELIPVLLFCVNAIMYASFALSEFWGITTSVEGLYWLYQQLFDSTLITLLLMYYVAYIDRWIGIPKVCLIAVSLLWLHNIPYVVLGYDVGVYFFTFAGIIYVTTLILSLRILTNR